MTKSNRCSPRDIVGASTVIVVLLAILASCAGAGVASARALAASSGHDSETLERLVFRYGDNLGNDGYSAPVDFRLRLAELRNDYEGMQHIVDGERNDLLDPRPGGPILGYHYGQLVVEGVALKFENLGFYYSVYDAVESGIDIASLTYEALDRPTRKVVLQDAAHHEANQMINNCIVAAHQPGHDPREVGDALRSSVDVILYYATRARVDELGRNIVLDLVNFVTVGGEYFADLVWGIPAGETLIAGLADEGLLAPSDVEYIREKSRRPLLPQRLEAMLSRILDSR
jgi:hypothetical protein